MRKLMRINTIYRTMKHIKQFERKESDFKYKVNDIIKIKSEPGKIYKICLVDTEDIFEPYLAYPTFNNSLSVWVKEDQIYQDEETKLYKDQIKFNL